jgi:hypothetical protein
MWRRGVGTAGTLAKPKWGRPLTGDTARSLAAAAVVGGVRKAVLAAEWYAISPPLDMPVTNTRSLSMHRPRLSTSSRAWRKATSS